MFRKVILLFLVLNIFSCEEDDFCDRQGTPKIVITFHDKENPKRKKSLPIYVWETEEKDTIYVQSMTDSIVLPLNTTAEQVQYNISYSNKKETLVLKYKPKRVFVSVSCGFKMDFHDLELESFTKDHWVNDVKLIKKQVVNEASAHITIFH